MTAEQPTLSHHAIDTLVALVECGPLEDGDVPSKRGRDELLTLGYAARIVVQLHDGWQAATCPGRDAYKRHFGTSMGGAADTMKEARANRIAREAIRSAGRQQAGGAR